MSLRMLFSMMVAFFFIVSGAYSFDISVSGGSGGSGFVDRLTINVDEQDSLVVNSVVNGAALLQDASGFGDLHKSFAANNRRGEKASITADVVGAGYWEYYQPEIFTDPTTASVSGFGLTATDAASIKCAATAQNRLGDKASAGVQVADGSLSNYWASANAHADGVSVSQSFGEASGQNIAVTERAADPLGSTSTLINVEDGSIQYYDNYDETFAKSYGVETVSEFYGAVGRKIAVESIASKAGYASNAEMNLEGTEIQDASVGAFMGSAGVDFGDMKTGALQYLMGAQGNLIELSENSINRERDRVSSSMQIRGMEPGYLGYYWGLTESFSGIVFAQNQFDWAQGDSISLSAASSNARSDRASIDASLIGNGLIESGSASSDSGAQFASASSSLNGFSANMTDCTASAASYWMGKATVHSNILGGSGSISNSASADSFAKTLRVEQEATVFGPAWVQGDTTAINTVGKKENAEWSSFVSEEYPLTYGQNASVVAGVPSIGMWAVL